MAEEAEDAQDRRLAADKRVSKYSILPRAAFSTVYALFFGNGIVSGRRYCAFTCSVELNIAFAVDAASLRVANNAVVTTAAAAAAMAATREIVETMDHPPENVAEG